MTKVHVVTVATESKYYFPYLVESCKRHGGQLEVLGMGEKWEGFNWKYVKMLEYLKTIPENDLVCFMDGYDVICVRDLNELADDFFKIQKETGCKIVVGKENHNIFATIVSTVYFGRCNKTLLNSGTYIGKSKDVLEVITKIHELNPKNDADDQQLMTQYCQKNNDIYIDTDNKLFLTISRPLTELDKYVTINPNDKSVTYKNENRPYFLHANGNGYLHSILRKLDYNVDSDKIKSQLFYAGFFKLLGHFKNGLKQYIFWILLLFVLIYLLVAYRTMLSIRGFQKSANQLLRQTKKRFK